MNNCMYEMPHKTIAPAFPLLTRSVCKRLQTLQNKMMSIKGVKEI